MTENNTEQNEESVSNFTRLRALLFLVLTLLIGVIVIILATWWVVGSAPRTTAISIDEAVTVSEYITLPDDDSYPAALAMRSDGTLYTGSYASGVIWTISADGFISEIDDTRERIGSVSGLDIAEDGSLYILDRVEALNAKGAVIWRYADGELRSVVEIPNDETVGVGLPDDIAVDNAGFIYITDRSPARVWRYSTKGENLGVWWTPSPVTTGEPPAPTGLSYDASSDSILITEGTYDRLYRVPATAPDLSTAIEQTETLYSDFNNNGYGLDGVTVSVTGDIYLALLGWNRVARLDSDGLMMLAQEFRGSSDVAYDAEKDVLFVTNWNQFSLGFGTSPQLPFALDIIDLSPDLTTE